MTEPRPASQSLLSRMVSAYGPEAIGRAIGKQSALEDMLRFEWAAIARPEQMWKPGGNHRIFLYLAGRGCVAAGTMIFDPMRGEHREVSALAEDDEPLHVLAMTPGGPRPFASTAPFLKGWASLYRVTIDNGRSVVVTINHRFATPAGWRQLDDIPIGAPLQCESGWRRVKSVEYEGTGRFYDLTVPGPANYLANGIYHHNSGKTRAGAEWVRAHAASNPKHRIALVAPTAADVRDVIVEGDSGILACSPPDFMPLYEPSKRRLTWPNGAIATTYSADEPKRLRGPQHSLAWMDEPVAMTKPKECWDMLMFGLRLGKDTRAMVTTTPDRSKFIKQLMEDPRTLISRSTTYDNAANLDPDFLADIERRYRGTSLGRQELLGEVLSKVDGARWDLDAMISPHRVLPSDVPPLASIVVAVDPNTEGGEGNDAAGIVVMGCDANADHFYVNSDNTTQGGPHVWAPLSVRCFLENQADEIIVEANAGGEMVRMAILNVRDPETGEEIVPEIPCRKVNATRDKFTRADPVALLAEQGRIHHVGVLTDLEDELCSWCPGMKSPNRMDAYVHGIVALQERHRRRAGLAVATSYTIGGEPDETEDDEW